MTVQIAEIDAAAGTDVGTVRIARITAERDVASLGTVQIHSITAEVDDVVDQTASDFRVARGGRWQPVSAFSAATVERAGAVAVARDATDGTYLVTSDLEAAGVKVGDPVRLYHADGSPIDTLTHVISSSESAFGFTNLHLDPVTVALVTGDFLIVDAWI